MNLLSPMQTEALNKELNRRLLAYDKLFTFVQRLAIEVTPDDLQEKAQKLIEDITTNS